MNVTPRLFNLLHKAGWAHIITHNIIQILFYLSVAGMKHCFYMKFAVAYFADVASV